MSALHHYTVNTGHNRVCRKSEVPDSVIEVCRHLLVPGRRHSVPGIGSPFTVESVLVEAGFVFTAYRGNAPLITCGVSESIEAAETVWPQLENLYLKITDLPRLRSADFESPKQPPGLPWLAVVTITPSYEPWLGDFERCLAWTYLEQRRIENE